MDKVQPDFNLLGYKERVLEAIYSMSDRSFKYSGLWIFSGAQGSGKTLLMMECLKKIIQEYPEAMIVSNIYIFGLPCIPYTGLEDFDKYHNGSKGIIFVLDEIHTLFSSLESAGMSPAQIQVWSQNRKNRRLILGTTQRFSRAAKPLREQTTWHYECRRPILYFSFYRIIDGSLYDEQGKLTEPPPWWSIYVPKVSTMRMYSTLEVVRRDKDV